MKIILLLTANQSHARHVERWFAYDHKQFKIVTPQEVRHLLGYHPDMIIEMPEWFFQKSNEFCDRVELMKQEFATRK